jgi:hypothetical protein
MSFLLSPDSSYDEARATRLAVRAFDFKDARVEFEGLRFKVSTVNGEYPIPGQMYFAARNSGWKFLTCQQVIWWDNSVRPGIEYSGAMPTYVVPKEIAYCYDIHECLPIISLVE